MSDKWLGVIVKPQVRLARPRFGAPTRPPAILMFGVVFIAVLFILGGNIYSLVNTPPPIASGSGGSPILIAPSIDVQLGIEGLAASVIILVGVIGLGLLFYASRYVFQPGMAWRFMVLGMIMSGVAYLSITYLFLFKTGQL
ncbi:MAG: conserved membrane protein of unknown function [Candidatus Thorarchaeota archaeon]|nr:MAG: conserved membrane protein of unknown function [Candidatus Thorarchaeota archaeon]